MYILFFRVKLIAMYFPVVIIDCIVTCGQRRLSEWARCVVTIGPTRDPCSSMQVVYGMFLIF